MSFTSHHKFPVSCARERTGILQHEDALQRSQADYLFNLDLMPSDLSSLLEQSLEPLKSRPSKLLLLWSKRSVESTQELSAASISQMIRWILVLPSEPWYSRMVLLTYKPVEVLSSIVSKKMSTSRP